MTPDTIVAIATPNGRSAIALLRLSGAAALSVVKQHVAISQWQPRHAHFARFVDQERLVDEVVVTYFPAPHSYTGEEMVELSCHGSTYVQQQILQSLLASPEVRMAEPGEFTRRAFLNGKFDLSQAEAVADLIDSHSEASHRLAINQMRGGFSKELAHLRDQFVELTSLLELELDFSDEEVEFADRSRLLALIDTLEQQTRRLVDSFNMGNAIKNGVPVAIVGRPNAGKSTLLNALLNDDRAIVSPVAGTTRDTIEDTITLNGILFRFIDTAGLRLSTDTIESAGIDRSYQAMRRAQIILYLIDAVTPQSEVETELKEAHQAVDLSKKQLLLLRTKCDLHQPDHPSGIAISAATGQGLDTLRKMLVDTVCPLETDTTLLTNVRHYDAMVHMLEAISHIREGFNKQLPADLIVVDIRDALYHLGTITGQVTNDEVLGTIFSRFCIGK